ncbi:4-carboxymuconolactone decarboxylase [Nitrincola sp. A-D6]|uniref:carboxymuconolactone decarboxylase family protein n=1 Tax=Nitrincola sp. A-D6 TaxID=1545442 RepID=UPI00051FA246|nr:carboxymuconolactone decarboxylase family protein [Nitrincola sp. A-D6]KGK42590.1 4-carboxymuconolactone decarboxylase [Nitrincola sp. A-D6]
MQSRLTELTPENTTTEQQRVLDSILNGPRGNLDGPFLAWVHSPELADHAQKLGAYCRYHSRIPLRLSELAILTTAACWQSQAEWQIHEPIAHQAGISSQISEAIRTDKEPVFADAQEQLVYQITRTLYKSKRISDSLYQQAVAILGEAALVDLIGILGYYSLVAMTLNVFEVQRETDQPLPFVQP